MKVLYGVQGTGNEHITRSERVINKLKNDGYDVDVLVSGQNSSIQFSSDITSKGFTFKYDYDGRVDINKTFKGLDFKSFIKDIRLVKKDYDFVISDFEPISAWYARWYDKYSIGIGNQYSFLSNKIPLYKKKDYLSNFIVKNFAPVDNPIGLHYQQYDKYIYTPILREDVLNAVTSNNNYYIIYLPNIDYYQIFTKIKNIKVKFKIFSKIDKPTRVYNCDILPIDKKLFFKEFIGCAGIITAAGFQTTSEALFLNKKMMIIPIGKQWEQLCNKAALEEMGIFSGGLDDVRQFVESNQITKVNWSDSLNDVISNIYKVN